MPKNIKLNVKNTQIAEALNLNKLKKAASLALHDVEEKKKAPKKETPAVKGKEAHGKSKEQTEEVRPKARILPKEEKPVAPLPETLPHKDLKEHKESLKEKEPLKETLGKVEKLEKLGPIEVEKTPLKASEKAEKHEPSEKPSPALSSAHPSKELKPGSEKKDLKEAPKKEPVLEVQQKEIFLSKLKEKDLEEEVPVKSGFFKGGFKDTKSVKKAPVDQGKFDVRSRHGLTTPTEEDVWRRARYHKPQKKVFKEEEIIRPTELAVKIPISLKDLASAMKLKASQLIAKLFSQGIVVTLNDLLEDDTTIQLLGHEFGCAITIDTAEEQRLRITEKSIKEEIDLTSKETLKIRPPIVAFMGHVDHGKTSLIDKIRKTNIAAQEAGAITQHIGAFTAKIPSGWITILDTPGHEAFSEMRSRGALVTDIIVLVVAGDEGIKEQTKEAIEQAKAAKVPIVVAINKSDKSDFNPEKVYRELADQNLLPEIWGGTTITVRCSALTGDGIPELLEMLLLQAEVLELKANYSSRARGTVLESEMHKGLGSTATVLVQNGTLKMGDAIVVGHKSGRVKAMYNSYGQFVQEALPSQPVKISGLSDLPQAGDEFIVVASEKEAKELAQARTEGYKQTLLQQKKASVDLLKESKNIKILTLILKADVQGSLEALKNSFLKIHSEKAELNIIHMGVGEISESDIQLAAASKATIFGFHTKAESHAESLIKELKIPVYFFDIIYHAVDQVKRLMVALLDKLEQEQDVGKAEVKAVFKSSQTGNIAGCLVIDGLIKRNHHVRVIRGKEILKKGKIASLKRMKEDVKEVAKGMECGIVLDNFSDFQVGDILQTYEVTYLEQQL